MKIIFPTILIIISIFSFIFFINPNLKEIKSTTDSISLYNSALANSTNLQEVRDNLISSYSLISKEDKDKLNKLLPNSVDNIKFILEVEKIANNNSLLVKDIKFDVDLLEESNTKDNKVLNEKDSLPYGVFPIEFKVSGNYESFMTFVKELENNLRIVNIKSLSFDSTNANNKSGIYDFNLKVEIYWIK